MNEAQTVFPPVLMFPIVKSCAEKSVAETKEKIISDIMKYKLIFCCCGLLKIK